MKSKSRACLVLASSMFILGLTGCGAKTASSSVVSSEPVVSSNSSVVAKHAVKISFNDDTLDVAELSAAEGLEGGNVTLTVYVLDPTAYKVASITVNDAAVTFTAKTNVPGVVTATIPVGTKDVSVEVNCAHVTTQMKTVVSVTEDTETPEATVTYWTGNDPDATKNSKFPSEPLIVEGDTLNVTVAAIEGYAVSSVYYGSELLYADANGFYTCIAHAGIDTLSVTCGAAISITKTLSDGVAVSGVPATAAEGDSITFVPTVYTGFYLTSIDVVSAGKSIDFTDNGDGSYAFTVPATAVEVKVDADVISLASVTLSTKATTVKVNYVIQLFTAILPEYATADAITYTTSDKTIATPYYYAKYGVWTVLGVAAGTATISATTLKGTATVNSLTITVTAA